MPGNGAAQPAAQGHPDREAETEDGRSIVDGPTAHEHADDGERIEPVRNAYDQRMEHHCLGHRAYIGGVMPFLPTDTDAAVMLPSTSLRARTTTLAPATSMARSPASMLTIGTSAGTMIFFSPPLYFSVSVRPLLATTSPTLPLVMVLLGARSNGRWPSPVPAMAGGKTCTSSAFCEPSGCGIAAAPI